MAPNWWGTDNEVSPRLRLEVDVMRATFEDTFRLERENNVLFWVGTVMVNLKDLPRRDHTLKILYPRTYPNHPPEAYILVPKIVSPKHQFEDGQLCLFNPKDGIGYGCNPSTSTAVAITGWAIEWLYAFYTWKATGDWPGKEERIEDQRARFGRRR